VSEQLAEVNLLFTSVGRRVELLNAFRRAYNTLGIGGRISGIDVDPLAPGLQVVDRPYLTSRSETQEHIAHVLEICRSDRIHLVVPLTDPDIHVLAKHRCEIEATGAQVLVIPTEDVAVTRDKWLTCQLFHRLGLATPTSWLPDQIDPENMPYPLFIKPRVGSASKYTYRVNNSRELRFFLDYVPGPVVQAFIDGPEITTDVMCDLRGAVLGVVSRRRIEVRAGEVAKSITIHDERIADACVQIASALHSVGPITIQCIVGEGTPYFTEVNARFGGGAPLGIAAGVDTPVLLLARLADVAITAPPPGTHEVGLVMTRFDDSFFLLQDGHGKLASRRF
jgi:carbamoyl-phosphate synthase large subunit